MYRYNPWVGKLYNKKNAIGFRLLIVGESHFGMEEMYSYEIKEVTKKIIDDHLNSEKRLRFLTSIYKICNSNVNISEEGFWQSVVFYNYIQTKGNLMKAGDRPTKRQWKDSEKIFLSTIAKYQPQKILVLGKELWNKLPAGSGFDGDYEFTWYYPISSNKKALATYIYHPSRYPKGSKTRNSRSEFLKLVKIR